MDSVGTWVLVGTIAAIIIGFLVGGAQQFGSLLAGSAVAVKALKKQRARDKEAARLEAEAEGLKKRGEDADVIIVSVEEDNDMIAKEISEMTPEEKIKLAESLWDGEE